MCICMFNVKILQMANGRNARDGRESETVPPPTAAVTVKTILINVQVRSKNQVLQKRTLLNAARKQGIHLLPTTKISQPEKSPVAK